MRYGYFDDASREYVITRPDTPLPWINYLGSQEYFGLISNTAGGYSFYRDARLRRLTRYRYNNVPLDTGGRYIYLRDDASGRPTGRRPGSRPGPRWTSTPAATAWATRSSARRPGGIRAETRYFVPLGQNLEVWQLTLTNERDTAAQLSVFSAIEFCLWDAWDDATNFQRNFSTGQVEVEDGVIYHKTEYRERRNHFAYFACSEPLGRVRHPARGVPGPVPRAGIRRMAVEQGRGRATRSRTAGSPLARTMFALTLAPGESRTVIFVLGYMENPRDDKFDPPGSRRRINKRRVEPRARSDTWIPSGCRLPSRRCASYWDELLGKFQVQTPDEHTNRMVNIWNAYQCMITFNMSRSASFYRVGHRPRHGLPRLEPGPARLRPHDPASAPASASSTWPRRSCPPAAPTTSTSR